MFCALLDTNLFEKNPFLMHSYFVLVDMIIIYQYSILSTSKHMGRRRESCFPDSWSWCGLQNLL